MGALVRACACACVCVCVGEKGGGGGMHVRYMLYLKPVHARKKAYLHEETNLRKLAKAIQWVDVWGFGALKAREGCVVQLDLLAGRGCLLMHVVIVCVQRQGMPDEVYGHLIHRIVFVQLCHGHFLEIQALLWGRIAGVPFLDVAAGNTRSSQHPIRL